MTSEFDKVKDCKEREHSSEVDNPKVKMESLKLQAPNVETLGRKDKCKKKKPAHNDFNEQLIFLVFLILVLILISKG